MPICKPDRHGAPVAIQNNAVGANNGSALIEIDARRKHHRIKFRRHFVDLRCQNEGLTIARLKFSGINGIDSRSSQARAVEVVTGDHGVDVLDGVDCLDGGAIVGFECALGALRIDFNSRRRVADRLVGGFSRRRRFDRVVSISRRRRFDRGFGGISRRCHDRLVRGISRRCHDRLVGGISRRRHDRVVSTSRRRRFDRVVGVDRRRNLSRSNKILTMIFLLFSNVL